MKKLNRKSFLTTLVGAGSLITIYPTTLAQPAQQQKPDPLDPKTVREFVRLGHSDLEGVKKMLGETPSLLNATTDWGGGDFETALGGASHMGRKDIADFLIRKGARMDIFAAAMLGHVDLVKSIAEKYPEVLQSKGPHGITLLIHAQKGGEAAIPVVEFLNANGATK
jgi:hypothetical protein